MKPLMSDLSAQGKFEVNGGQLGKEINWLFQHLRDQSGDRRSLGASQGDVGKERMALERLDDGDDAIMAPHSKVVALGDVVGEDYSRALADSREDCK